MTEDQRELALFAVVILGLVANKFSSFQIHKFALRNKDIWVLDLVLSIVVWLFVFSVVGTHLWSRLDQETTTADIAALNLIMGCSAPIIQYVLFNSRNLEKIKRLIEKINSDYWWRHADKMNPFADHYDMAGNFVKGVEHGWFADYDLDKVMRN